MNLLYACTDPGIPVRGTKGASIHVRSLAGALAADGLAVTIAAARPGDGPCDLGDGVTVVGLGLGAAAERRIGRAAGARAGALRAHLAAGALAAAAPAWRARGVDAVYERYSLFGAGGRSVAQALGVPHVVEVNAPLTLEAARYRALPWPRTAAAIERAVLTGADAVVAVSDALSDWLAGLGVARDRIVVLPNAVDADAFAAGAAARHATRARLRLADRSVVGFVGSLKPWHGADDLLSAFARVAGDDPRAALLVVGDGPLRPAIEARAGALGLGDRVRFTGAVPHTAVPALLAACDAAVVPYAADAAAYFSPLKLFESLAAAVPTVAADVPGVRAVVAPGRTAVLYRPGDVDDLARAVASVLASPQAARAIGEAGRAAVVARHTWRHNAAAVVARLAALGAGDGAGGRGRTAGDGDRVDAGASDRDGRVAA